MDEKLFELVKDFYTLRTEYEVNMKSIQQSIRRLDQDVSKLTKSFNELRDALEEHVKDIGYKAH